MAVTILFVDDEVRFADNMSKLLHHRGYRVTTAYSGEDAVRILDKQKFDVVVMDLKMPGLDGLDALREIKKLGLVTETLILTGHGAIDTAIEATRLGAYDFLTKPCEINDLVVKIENAFDKKDGNERKRLESKVKQIMESEAF